MMRVRHISWALVSSFSLIALACSSGGDDGGSTPDDGLEPEDQVGMDGEGKFDAWDYANNPANVDPNFSYFVHQLPLEGNGPVPIPGDYWATQKDNLNHEWDGAGSSPAEKYSKAFNKPNLPKNITNYHGIESATGAKVCTQGGNECAGETDGSSCAIPKGATKGRCIPGWWGICHGWAPYALAEAPAKNPVTKNGVTFYPGDLEGLMSLLYTDVDTKFVSRRCNKENPVTDGTGRITATECRDMNPGSWHIIATNMMGLRRQGFNIDATFDLQVWNQPGYGYKVTNPVDGKLKEISKAEAVGMLGANLTMTEIFPSVMLKKDETKAGEYVATAAGELTIKLSGSGDADLYVKKGSAPTESDYDCRPYGGNSNEECPLTVAAGDKVFYMVKGYGAESNVALSAAVPGANGDYTYNTLAKRFFYVEMDFTYIVESKPAKQSHVDQALTSYATTKHYKYILEADQGGKIMGGEWVGESRTNHPDFAWWPTSKPLSSQANGDITYAEVKALNDEAAGAPAPADSVTVMDGVVVKQSGTAWASKYASVTVEQGFKKLEVTMTGTGAAELYVRAGRNPTVYSYDCKSTTAGTSSQTCTVNVSFNGNTYFVRARSKTPNTTVTVNAKKLK